MTTLPANIPQERVYSLHPEKKVTLYFLMTGFLALLIGALIGPLQALNYAGINLYQYLPFLQSYYQGLTLHGVLNALVFTTLAISGLLLYLPCRALGVRPNLVVAWIAYWTSTIGVVLAAIAALGNNATVLYTFYPPLMGSPLFYIGAAMLVAGSLVIAVQVIVIWTLWKRQHPGERTPLVAYMSVATWFMWIVAALGLVSEVVFILIPWSLGLTSGVDALLTRTLFWYTGHAIVYFWVLPAYISWYAFLPRQAGGVIASETLARLAFVLFLLISTPVGLHHQFADPGIGLVWKVLQMLLTFLIAVPSLLTAFSVGASLELGARARGGWFGWIRHLPWKDASFTGQTLALVSFIFGGTGGIANASLALDSVVHNTAWIPGHFHITVGTATTMTFFAISFWLLPHLTRKPLVGAKVALWSMWLWFIGMMLFALGMHWEGLIGLPRRTFFSGATGLSDMIARAHVPMALTGISGVVLLVATLLYFGVIFATLLGRRRVSAAEETPIPFSTALGEPSHTPAGARLRGAQRALEHLWVFFGVALLLVLLMYGPTLAGQLANPVLVPGQRLW